MYILDFIGFDLFYRLGSVRSGEEFGKSWVSRASGENGIK